MTRVSHKLSFEEKRYDSINCVYILIQRTKNLKHMLLIASKREIFQYSDDENYHQITLKFSLLNNFDSFLLVSILSVAIDFFSANFTFHNSHHQNSFIFLQRKKCAIFLQIQ